MQACRPTEPVCNTSWWCQKINSKLHGPHVLETTPVQHKKRRSRREHQYGAGQIPSEGQVRISHNSRVLEWVNYAYLS